ncbi:MAG: di-trans,poly-cis-decaprenylcistransferase [Rhodospirillaceae bacterium]|nr:di-trans,poly-cis-decaprenylcistransferase [Rhodospirillaceae bacterium]MDD9924562.1 di-trans,poly-cis-decaprenylcistransferase [Rhodospirillaceae bacterium]
MQSNLQERLHVALIMDGNGRWARQRNRPRSAGHRAGVETVRRLMEAAPSLGVGMMTLYAFSSDNWKRPAAEVSFLMRLLQSYLEREVEALVENDVRLVFIGRRDRVPAPLAKAMSMAEARTSACRGLTVRIALDYSARDAILNAARRVENTETLDRDSFSRLLNGGAENCDVDLLIRTSGEKRLSDFLLWECAYSEFYFTDRHWPDFTAADLAVAVNEFRTRDRRFGGIEIPGEAVTVEAERAAI